MSRAICDIECYIVVSRIEMSHSAEMTHDRTREMAEGRD